MVHLMAFCQLRTIQKWIRSKKIKDVKKITQQTSHPGCMTTTQQSTKLSIRKFNIKK